MTPTVKSWLATQITRMDSVQKCVLDAGADIVVHSWRGILVHVHLVEEAMKARALKKKAQDATRNGIGTLFIANAKLLPPDGARLAPAEWLLALHAMTDNKIYAYRVEKGVPHIFQAHFKLTAKSDERDVWHGPDIAIHQMPFYRIWVRTPPAVKGDYLIANFAADPFWHNSDYRNARAAAFEQVQRAQRQAEYARYDFGYGNSAGPELIQPPPTKLARSYAALGLPQGANCEEVKAAFRRLALEVHPDTGKLPKAEAEARFRAITEAYNTIREADDCS